MPISSEKGMSRDLHLYTLAYPYGHGEGFIENELLHLSERFDHVYIHPWNASSDIQRNTPENVSVQSITSKKQASFMERWKLMLPYTKLSSFRKNWRYQFAHAGQLLALAESISQMYANDHSVHYSYWLSDWATVLGLAHKRSPSFSYIARAHGFDVYNERQLHGQHLYRDIQLKGLKKLYPISKLAGDYITQRYSGVQVEVEHLGTRDLGVGPSTTSDALRIISCSAVSELKRVHLIPRLLRGLEQRVEWTHIGDGPLMARLKQSIEKCDDNIKVHLTGFVPPDEVNRIYQENSFDIFLHVSSSEGIPVSMMEAISFGIPIVATDVGAVKEIVNERTGRLLEEHSGEMSISSFKAALSALPSRQSVRQFWEENFMATRNYPAFAQKLYES
jgi:glycosyltransferase involved in cell wall biosynthesis